MKNTLERFYAAFGDRGVMFLLYAVSVVLHALLSVTMELPAVHPDEIGVASIAAMYSGRDWSGIMGNIGYYYGYIQALLYTPLFWLFGSSPFALYKSMLVMNGVLISFIPPIAYHLASKLGVEKVWQKIIIASCSGLYITYIAHSKFIWNEAICSLLPWVLIWCVFMAWDRKNRYSRFSMSVLTGFLCAVCYAAHQRLIAVVIALVLTLIIARVFFKENILNIPVFVLTAAVSFVTEHFCTQMIKNNVWRGGADFNTFESEIDRFGNLTQPGGLDRFTGTLYGHLYSFMTSTLGLGALAAVLLFCLVMAAYNDAADNRKRSSLGEDGTKEYVAPKKTYSVRLTIFSIYGFFAIGGSLLLSVLFKFGSSKLETIKDLTIFGRYTDNVAPMAIFMVLVFLFLYGLKLSHVLGAAGLYGIICGLFALTGYGTLAEAGTYRESPILAILPWRIGEDITEPITGMSFVIMSACVFTVFALMIVLICCTKHYYTHVISTLTCAAFVYTTVFTGSVYLPMRAEENADKTAPAEAICEYLYNDEQSPVIVAYLIPSRTAALVQFMNPETRVEIVRDKTKLPETCILIAENTRSVPFEVDSYDVIGHAEGYTIYAYGESARDFIKYKANS